jgi:hypothetical protein
MEGSRLAKATNDMNWAIRRKASATSFRL